MITWIVCDTCKVGWQAGLDEERLPGRGCKHSKRTLEADDLPKNYCEKRYDGLWAPADEPAENGKKDEKKT